MNSFTDHVVWDILGDNAAWMLGNTALAWAGVLFLWTTRRFERHPGLAGSIVIACATALPAVRLVRLDERPSWLVIVLACALLGALATFWVLRARRGDRWALWLALLGAVAFSPNAPYVLTDGMHFVQDVRSVRSGLVASTVLALVYGWFLAIALAAWIVLVRIARWFVAPRWRLLTLGLVSFVMAAGIYIGRIVRVNSWQIVTDPLKVLRALADIVLHQGPALFTFVWTLVVVVVAVVGVLSVDAGERTPRRLSGMHMVEAWAWTLAGAWLLAMPIVARFDREVDLTTQEPSRAAAVGAVVIGAGLVLLGLVRYGVHRSTPVRAAAVAASALVVLGPVLVVGSTFGWWAQYRTLCHLGPERWNGEPRCVDERAGRD